MAKKKVSKTSTHPTQHDHIHGGAAALLLERNLPVLSRSMTFAKMVRAELAAVPDIRALSWLFPALCHRKDQLSLTDTEKARYLCAFSMINNDGTLGQLVDIHGQMHM